jgi:hypothetical protein
MCRSLGCSSHFDRPQPQDYPTRRAGSPHRRNDARSAKRMDDERERAPGGQISANRPAQKRREGSAPNGRFLVTGRAAAFDMRGRFIDPAFGICKLFYADGGSLPQVSRAASNDSIMYGSTILGQWLWWSVPILYKIKQILDRLHQYHMVINLDASGDGLASVVFPACITEEKRDVPALFIIFLYFTMHYRTLRLRWTKRTKSLLVVCR